MPSLRANTWLFVLLLPVPAAALAVLGVRSIASLEREVERGARDELTRRTAAFAAALPQRVEGRLRELEAEVQALAPRVAVELPVAGAAGLARVEADAGIALCVRDAAGAALAPADVADVRLVELPEWPRFELLLRGDASVRWQDFESPALRARGVALALAAEPEAAVAQLPELSPSTLAAAGPLVAECLCRSEAGRARLAALRDALWQVPGTERARLAWLVAAGADAEVLARQRLRVAREVGEPLLALRAALPGGASLERLVAADACLAALAAVDGACSFACVPAAGARGPEVRDDDAFDVVQATSLGLLRVRGVHRELQALRTASVWRRVLTGAGVVSLCIVMAAGVLFVRRALQHEAAARELRDRFLANVSHDLKTPLTSLRLYAEMLTDPGLDAATRARYAAVVEAEGARMSALVEDLLDVSALQQGRRRIEPEPVDLGAAVQALAAAWRPLVERDGIALRCTVEDGGGEAVAQADPKALGRILTNLMQNALRHGRPPRDGKAPWIALQAGPGPRLCVRDNGPGVPAALRERVFDRFVRGDEGREGLGLGLALSRELAEACGGTLRCDDDGTTVFVLELPAAPAHGDE